MTSRHTLLCVIACDLLVASLNAGAQRAEKVAHIGMLCFTSCESPGFDALQAGLRSAGWVEGSNLHIDYRAAGNRFDRLPALAQELVDLKPDLIVASGPQPSRAAKNATSTIPIVFLAVADPVRIGLVESLARPGGNVTGVATVVPGGFIAKSLEVFTQALPKAVRIAALLNPTNEVTNALFPMEAPPAARQLGVQLQVYEVRVPEDIERAIDAAVLAKVDALWVVGDQILHNPPQRVPDLAMRARLPSMYLVRELVDAGGLMPYGPDFIELSRRGTVYDGAYTRILDESLKQLLDRLQHGDPYVVGGEVKRKPVSARDLALVAAITVDKRQAVRDLPAPRKPIDMSKFWEDLGECGRQAA